MEIDEIEIHGQALRIAHKQIDRVPDLEGKRRLGIQTRLPPAVSRNSLFHGTIDFIVRTDDDSAMRFAGGKFRCYQKLINLIPRHRIYIESHLGGGAVLRHKAPAELNIGIDPDPVVIASFTGFPANYRFLCARAEDFLASHSFQGDEFIYADPPYWPLSRASARPVYSFDYQAEDHVRLLRLFMGLPCKVMISGYANPVYAEMLAGWRCHTFQGTSHIGTREESLWLNYHPAEVHDVRYLGHTFRDRQSIKRKRQRWLARFSQEPLNVQQALLHDLNGAYAKKREDSRRC